MKLGVHLLEEFKRLQSTGYIAIAAWKEVNLTSLFLMAFVDRCGQDMAFAASGGIGAIFKLVLVESVAFNVVQFNRRSSSSLCAHTCTSLTQRLQPHTSRVVSLPCVLPHVSTTTFHPWSIPPLTSAYSPHPSPSLSPSPSATPKYHPPHC